MTNTFLCGGYTERSISDSDVVEAVTFAMERLNMMSNSILPHELNRVKAAGSQVVAGTNYKLLVETQRGDRVEEHSFEVFKGLDGNLELSKHQPL
ncbi:hypothetical protein P9112_012725 [Eukaryota sp. TZLM1-RC]